MKVFEIDVRSVTTGVMCVQAENEAAARALAAELLDTGAGDWDMDMGGGFADIDSSRELFDSSDEEKEKARKNKEAYEELNEAQA